MIYPLPVCKTMFRPPKIGSFRREGLGKDLAAVRRQGGSMWVDDVESSSRVPEGLIFAVASGYLCVWMICG